MKCGEVYEITATVYIIWSPFANHMYAAAFTRLLIWTYKKNRTVCLWFFFRWSVDSVVQLFSFVDEHVRMNGKFE